MFFWEKIADQKIRQAQREGGFDNLPGAGKPIDLKEYFRVAGEWRMAYDLLKKSNVIPREIQQKKDIERLRGELANCNDKETAELIRRDIDFKNIELEILFEKRRKRR